METLKINEQSVLEQRDYKIVKSNDLIQKSRFQLTLQEQKIILYIISKVKPDDNSFEINNFNINEFCQVCGIKTYNGKNYKNIKDTLKSLSDKSIWIKLDSQTETIVRWINKAWINKNSGTIKIRLDDDLKPYLLQLKERFTSYELLYTLAMRSQYSIRLYELLKSYEFKKKQIFELNDLKSILSAENYTRYPDFKRKVLDISMREINQLSDLNIDFAVIKEGRKYAKINFNIKVKKDITERTKTWARIEQILNPPSQISLFESN